MITENEKELSTLFDKFSEPNAQLSKEELHQIIFLLGSEQEDGCISQLLQQDWDEDYRNFDKVNYERISARIKQQMQASRKKPLSFMQFFYRCAAALLLPLLGLSAYFMVQTINSDRSGYTEIVEILEPPGMQSRISLSDGSIVVLKDGSLLNQKNNFGGNTREVVLEGEAFFEIAHNPNKPFIIHTGRIRTTALGTTFSIRAEPGEALISISVAEGKVMVEDDRELLAILEANQQFTYGFEYDAFQKKAIEIDVIEMEALQPYLLIFRNMPFGNIVQELAVRHGVNIVFSNEELKRQRISVLLDSRNSIEELLIFLSASQGAIVTAGEENYVIKSIK